MNSGESGSALCSIVIPTLDRRDRLLRLIALLGQQTHPHLEIVVSDDGSSDGTADAVRSLADDAVHVVRSETRTGVGHARNRGIAAARGEFVAFCDDDDLWVPTKLERQIGAMQDADRAWSCCGAVHVDDALEPVHATEFPTDAVIEGQLLQHNVIPGGCSGVVVRRDALDALGGFDAAVSVLADWDLWIRLLGHSGLPASVPSYEVLYLVHEGQMSGDLRRITPELRYLRNKHADARGRSDLLPIDGIDHWVIHSLRRAGRTRDALRHALMGIPRRTPRALKWSLSAALRPLGPSGFDHSGAGADLAAARAAVASVSAIVEPV